VTIRLAWTIDPRWRLGPLDGRNVPPILTGFRAGRAVMGRGAVLLLGPLCVWWTRDLYEVEVTA
jgi:hypothetical protein